MVTFKYKIFASVTLILSYIFDRMHILSAVGVAYHISLGSRRYLYVPGTFNRGSTIFHGVFGYIGDIRCSMEIYNKLHPFIYLRFNSLCYMGM